jgi:hypothetical protein
MVRKRFRIKLGMGYALYMTNGERFKAVHVPGSTVLSVDIYQIVILDHALSIDSRRLDTLVDEGILRELP